MEERKRIGRILLVTGTFGFFVFTMVVITEIVRLSIHSL